VPATEYPGGQLPLTVMKHIQTNKPGEKTTGSSCSVEGKDCGCSNGMCPGMILGGIMLAGWGLYAVGAWVWGMIAG